MRAQAQPFGPNTQVLTWLLLSNIVIYITDLFISKYVPGSTTGEMTFLQQHFALSIDNLQGFKVWTLITYGFLHNTDFPLHLHIIFNLLLIYFMGRNLEAILGSRRFAGLYFLSLFMGGLLWAFIHSVPDPNVHPLVVGASAGAYGLLIYFCCMQPNRPLTFLLFFIIPITLKPKWIIGGVIAYEFATTIYYEVMGNPGGTIAHSAHLGGIIGALIAFWMFTRYQPSFSRKRDGITMEPPKWMKGSKIASAAKQKFKVNVVSRKEMQAEVDRILDKINRRGFGALTLEEKETLDRAKEFLRK